MKKIVDCVRKNVINWKVYWRIEDPICAKALEALHSIFGDFKNFVRNLC